MIVWHWVQQHRLLTVLILAFVIVSSAGGTAWALVFRTVSSPVGLREALRIYRREQADKMLTTLRNHLPAPGVYSYRTTGGESLSLMGVARSFPSTTSMIVENKSGNCATVSWVPITEHTETTTECAGASGGCSACRGSSPPSRSPAPIRLRRSNAPRRPICCRRPASSRARKWAATCLLQSPAEKVLLVGEVLGQSTMTVGGHAVTVEHSRFTLTFDGSQAGTNPTDFWIVPSSGLIVQEKEEVGVTSGGVRYSENMASTLTDLKPAE